MTRVIVVNEGEIRVVRVATVFVTPTDHGVLGGLLDDDHTQYLTEARHDALAADNPHSVDFSQAVAADAGTDITAAEAETLTDGSNADPLHAHAPIDGADHGSLAGLADDDHAQYLTEARHDALAADNPHSVTKAQVGLGSVTDDAQLKRSANDFSTFTEKTDPSDADLLLIEDSTAAGVKKKVQAKNFIGDLGVGLQLDWRFSTTTTSGNPGSGTFRYNNATPASITEIFVNDTTRDGGIDAGLFLSKLASGDVIYIQQGNDATKAQVFNVTGAATDNTGWWTIPVTRDNGGALHDNNRDCIWILFIGLVAASGAVGVPKTFEADQLENPNNADWAVNSLAPALADTNNNGLTIRAFDDTAEEGVGFKVRIPSTAANVILRFFGRAETTDAAARTVGLKIYEREFPDDAAVTAWSAGLALDDIDIPTNELFQYDEQTLTLAALGVTAGSWHQFELTRIAPSGGTNLVGDWDLLAVEIDFS